MANLGTFDINTNGSYVKLSEITNIVFTAGEKYNLQLNKGAVCMFCEKTSLPENEEGFRYFGNEIEPIPYLVEEAELYVKDISKNCKINIAKKES